MQTFTVIGLGAVGRTLAVRLGEVGWLTGWLIGRPRDRSFASRLKARLGTQIAEISQGSRVIIIAVPTGEVESVIDELARLQLNWKKTAVFHCAGALGQSVLKPLARKGAAVAACHPYQTFPRGASKIVNLNGTSFGITGNRGGVVAAKKMVHALGGIPLLIPEKARVAYHASAVIACSQLAADLTASVKILKSLGLSEKEAESAALAIASETVQNIRELGLRTALTGPAVRGDTDLIRLQTQALYKIDPDISQAYGLMSRWVMKQTGKIQNPKSKKS